MDERRRAKVTAYAEILWQLVQRAHIVGQSLPDTWHADAKAVLDAIEAKTVRCRKPQDPRRWPPSMSLEQIETAIDAKCGCHGKYDCDCVSVFNQTCSQAWWDHNSKDRRPRDGR